MGFLGPLRPRLSQLSVTMTLAVASSVLACGAVEEPGRALLVSTAGSLALALPLDDTEPMVEDVTQLRFYVSQILMTECAPDNDDTAASVGVTFAHEVFVSDPLALSPGWIDVGSPAAGVVAAIELPRVKICRVVISIGPSPDDMDGGRSATLRFTRSQKRVETTLALDVTIDVDDPFRAADFAIVVAPTALVFDLDATQFRTSWARANRDDDESMALATAIAESLVVTLTNAES